MRTLLSLLAVATAIGLTFLDSLPAAAPVASPVPPVAQPVFSCPCGEVCHCAELRAENERLGLMVAALEARNRELTATSKPPLQVLAPVAKQAAPQSIVCKGKACQVVQQQSSGGLFGGRFRRGR